MPNEIPVLQRTDDAKSDPTWMGHFSQMMHPNYVNPVFFRHNMSNMNFYNIFHGETVYLIGRGPSLRKFVENKAIAKMLYHPSTILYGMNSSPEVLNCDVQLWSCVDQMTKFPKRIYKNPNIMKFIPMNRMKTTIYDPRNHDDKKTLCLSDDNGNLYPSHCPNMYGVQTFIYDSDSVNTLSFGKAFLTSPSVLYGYYKGQKSVFLFALKICILLGFKRIVLVGVDYKMDKNEPYYQQTSEDFNAFHVQHNNRLYNTTAPILKEIHNLLKNKKTNYRTEIVTAQEIELMPFIPTTNLKEELERDIQRKS
jgi:hypothetical protein